MSTILSDMSVKQFQLFVKQTYELPNNRSFELTEMLNQTQKFALRGLRGVRKGKISITKKNLMISFTFFSSILNRLNIDLEDEVWLHFPYMCSKCSCLPCACKETDLDRVEPASIDFKKRPKTMGEFQFMLDKIYPPHSRTFEFAGVFFAERVGEFSEKVWNFRAGRSEESFDEIRIFAAKFFCSLVSVFSSMSLDLAEELTLFYPNNCHECSHSPCICSFDHIRDYKAVTH